MKKMMNDHKNIEQTEKIPEERDHLMQTINSIVDESNKQKIFDEVMKSTTKGEKRFIIKKQNIFRRTF